MANQNGDRVLEIDLRPSDGRKHYEFVTRGPVVAGPYSNVDVGDDNLNENAHFVRGYGSGYFDTYLVSSDFTAEDLLHFRAWHEGDESNDARGDIVVTIDGEQVPAKALKSRPNTLAVVGTGENAKYEATLEPGSSPVKTDERNATINGGDEINAPAIEGGVSGGTDMYRFADGGDGTLEAAKRAVRNIKIYGNATLKINGNEVDPADVSDRADAPHTLEIGSSGGRVEYEIHVTGGAIKNTGHESATVDGNDKVTDTDSGAKLTGTVQGGLDAYRFAGTIAMVFVNGNKDAAALTVNGEDKTELLLLSKEEREERQFKRDFEAFLNEHPFFNPDE